MNKKELLSSLRKRGFSKKILDAFSKVRREDFIFESLKHRAYHDTALPIGHSQTISQPYTIAVMLSMLEPRKSQKVLEVGSGCGYVLALLSELVGEKGEIYGIELVKELAEKSKENLFDYNNIKIFNKNGAEGLEDFAHYNRILISAGCEEVPDKLFSQLKEGGFLVAPVGPRYEQVLTKFQKKNSKIQITEKLQGFVFVPFIY